MTRSAQWLSGELARSAESVCRRYLSNGRRDGRYWTVGDVHNTPGRSLYVRLRGPGDGACRPGKWTDAATGEHGDLLDLIQLTCGLGGVTDAMTEARRFLSLPEPEREIPPIERRPALRGSSEAARRLWAAGRPISGTPAERYLHGRGLTLICRGLPLRYHSSCFHQDRTTKTRMPALLAAVTDDRGTVTGVHRTWLDATTALKAAVETPRKAMGELLGRGVRFGQAGAVMVAGEGLETVLSLRLILPPLPCIAALSAAHLGALVFPPGLQRLYVAEEADAAGRRAMERLRTRGEEVGIEVRSLRSVAKDFNDDLRALGADQVRRRVLEQLRREDAEAVLQHRLGELGRR